MDKILLNKLDDYFLDMNERTAKGVFFCRLNSYSFEVEKFIKKYCEEALKNGIIIDEGLKNPDGNNLNYYNEIVGNEFAMNLGFFIESLQKWLPGMNNTLRNNVATSVYDALYELQRAGKNSNMLKNAFIKYMCWLYYKFGNILKKVNSSKPPKVLFEGYASTYELDLLSILSKAGCDILLLQYKGDEDYLKNDSEMRFSQLVKVENETVFPEGFSVKALIAGSIKTDSSKIIDAVKNVNDVRAVNSVKSINTVDINVANSMNDKVDNSIDNDNGVCTEGREYEDCKLNCTNAWLNKQKGLEDIKTPVLLRGNDKSLFYNCFYRINGAEDKVSYANELLQFKNDLVADGRSVVVVSGSIASPENEEVAQIRRGNYENSEQMIKGLSMNLIRFISNKDLQKIVIKAFKDVLREEALSEGMNYNKLYNRAVYLLCFFRRYQSELFKNWMMPQISCFIFLGGCQNSNEALFMKFLSRIPCDVLVLRPNLNSACCLSDDCLLDLTYEESINLEAFPSVNAPIKMGTAAYHAERDLDSFLYQGTGIYRQQQFSRANVITLQTMYEEIERIWDVELKYRANFSTSEDVANIPVIFAKISGVKDENTEEYWKSIKKLLTPDTILIKKTPYIEQGSRNPIMMFVTSFLVNGKLQTEKIKKSKCYRYGYLREDMQDFILERIQALINQHTIVGIGTNGMEYVVVATLLNLSDIFMRMIQKFDFTQKNPKLIYIVPTKQCISLEDTIIVSFLNLVGFDILFFVPSGFRTVEQYFNNTTLEEYIIGDYMYDLQVPDFAKIKIKDDKRKGLLGKLFNGKKD
ncbi:MAG: YceG family protein [Lachnospiraceae bacterium]|nr:YceG family protein [Lachnospiraceae bacterium]